MCLTEIRARITRACKDAQRDAQDVTLVAVCKNQTADKIIPLLQAGQRVFGENRVQEAAEKWPELRAAYPNVELHLIGQLQTNKAKEAVKLFDVVESLDRPALAEALAKEMKKQNRDLPCFIQVNTGEEPQKGGIAPRDVAKFYDDCRKLGLRIAGLMCIPPAEDVAALHFALLQKLAREISPQNPLMLSMGMSADFESAIRCGASHVRIGTALFEIMKKD
ncbi:MAG TPA: YggS family pyridoxal phosphate-dependent enzyme [Alphaproteobacteria bacterium]|nr:YggS family pyridoxal phosphate-dependent enzyme [Alphaproteobacteria bacterium]